MSGRHAPARRRGQALRALMGWPHRRSARARTSGCLLVLAAGTGGLGAAVGAAQPFTAIHVHVRPRIPAPPSVAPLAPMDLPTLGPVVWPTAAPASHRATAVPPVRSSSRATLTRPPASTANRAAPRPTPAPASAPSTTLPVPVEPTPTATATETTDTGSAPTTTAEPSPPLLPIPTDLPLPTTEEIQP